MFIKEPEVYEDTNQNRVATALDQLAGCIRRGEVVVDQFRYVNSFKRKSKDNVGALSLQLTNLVPGEKE